MLVESQCLECMFDGAGEIGIVEFILLGGMRQAKFRKEGSVRDAKRADGIPHTYGLNTNLGAIWIIDSCQVGL